MAFLKKNWKRGIFVGLAVFSIGAFISWWDNAPQEPVILYKTAQPSKPQTNVENTDSSVSAHSHDHNHGHDPATHSHAVEETPSREGYDWRDDRGFDSASDKTDPWRRLDVQQADAESASSEDSETYPPRDWHKTEDPVLFAEYLNAQLLKQFGDIPEVHIIGEYELNKAMGITLTVEEHITFREAHYHLFPTEANKRTLEVLKGIISNGGQIVFK